MPDITPDSAEDIWALPSSEAGVATEPPIRVLSWWARLGVTGIFLSIVAPLVGVVGLWMAAWLGQLAASGLEISRAKLPLMTGDPNWDIRFVYLFALVLLGTRVVTSALPRPTWKLAGLGPWGLWLVMGAMLWTTAGTTLALERHVLDLADGIHLVVLGATAIWTTATTMWLIVSAGHAILTGVRIAGHRSALASGAVAVVGISTMAIATPLLANPELLDGTDVYSDAPVLAAIKGDVEEAGNMLAANMSDEPLELGGSRVEPSPPSFGGGFASDETGGDSEPDGLFATCMEQMVVPHDGASIKDEVTRKLGLRYGRVAHEIDDLVEWKMIDVCSDERERSRDSLQAYLYKMSKNAAVSRVRKLQARDRHWSKSRCLIDQRGDEITEFEEHQYREMTVARSLAKLPSGQRELLEERYFDDLSYEEMAARRGKSADTISRATSRARMALRVELEGACN